MISHRLPWLTGVVAAFALTLAAQAAQAQRVQLPRDVAPDHYAIAITPDRAALTFKGRETIDLTVLKTTRRIVLNAADLVIDQARLSGQSKAPVIAYDAKVETVTFSVDHDLTPGKYRLSLAYHGRIYRQASGLFALDYKTAKGERRALFTQFENSDARRFAPLWDEPDRKATFTLTATVPAGEMALSNMPVQSQRPAGKNLRTVTFATTPKMSSYLLFFGLGDFERVHRRIGGVDVGVVVKRGDTADAAFALKAATEILPYYNAYFGKPYPLPKLDLIAGPGSSQFFGAMENWGAIFYFERDLLIDPRISTQRDRQAVYVTIAHEMAHQWFGDLVTMAWWDDLWLNEGFASWMENKASDHFHPEWKLWLQAIEDKNDVMQTDARDGTHPIITPINDVLQAGGAFDGITYQKGEAVIRMLEAYVGEEAFRAGVRRYIAAHAYGNTVTDDLWREIDAVSPGRPITQIAHDFTLQSGVPLIRERSAICDDGRTRLSLEQDRFAADETARAPRVWRVPVAVAVPGGGTERTVVAGGARDEVSITSCQADLSVVLNAGQTSYFRSVYTPPGLAALTERFAALSAEDQLGLIVDTQALAYVGDQPMAAFLTLTRRLDAKTDPIIWRRVASAMRDLDLLYDGSPGQGAFRAYVRGLLGPVLARIGWDAAPGESDNIALMRTEVLTTLGAVGDPAVIAEARKRFEGFVRDPTTLDAAARDVVLTIVARQADAATWDQLHALARAARTELERAEFYRLLGRAADPVIAQRGLDLALSGEASATTEPSIIRAVSALHPALAEDFAIAHWGRIEALLEPDSRPEFVPRIVAQGSDVALIDKMNAFADAHIPADARQEVHKAAAQVAFRARVRQQRLPDVDRWLAGPNSGIAAKQ